MKTQRNYYPKAGRCRGCAQLQHDCSALPFASMPVHRTDGADSVVICTEFRQLNHDASLKPPRRRP